MNTRKKVRTEMIKVLEKKIAHEVKIANSTNDVAITEEAMGRAEDYYAQLERIRSLGKSNTDWEPYLKVAGGLLSIGLILNYEKTEILNTKALPFAQRLLGL